MKLTKLTIERTLNLGNYENERQILEVEVMDGESIEEVYGQLEAHFEKIMPIWGSAPHAAIKIKFPISGGILESKEKPEPNKVLPDTGIPANISFVPQPQIIVPPGSGVKQPAKTDAEIAIAASRQLKEINDRIAAGTQTDVDIAKKEAILKWNKEYEAKLASQQPKETTTKKPWEK